MISSRRAALSAAIMLATAALAQPSQSADGDKPLSDYTEQLINLMALWSKLNQAVADRMQQNERYLLAKAMLRMSSGFYALKIAKDGYVASIEAEPPNGAIDYSSYVPAVQKLQEAVQCFIRQLDSEGARLGVLTELNGKDIETNLRKGLEEKVADLRQVAKDLDVRTDSQDVATLKASLIKDGNAAVAAADYLQQKSAEFAHILDPSAVLSGEPPCGASLNRSP
jgi:hypothetical protein